MFVELEKIMLAISYYALFPEPQRSARILLGLNTVGTSNRAEPAENWRAQRRHRLGRHTRNPASDSHGPLRSGVDLFGRASRGHIATLKITKDPFRVSIPIIKKFVLVYLFGFLEFIHHFLSTAPKKYCVKPT